MEVFLRKRLIYSKLPSLCSILDSSSSKTSILLRVNLTGVCLPLTTGLFSSRAISLIAGGALSGVRGR